MRLKRIEIKNFVGIRELAIDVAKINRLTGHKGSGKSSFLEALEKAFTNKSSRTEIVRHDEEEATIFIETDNGLEIDRRIRNDRADYLKIRKPGEAVPQTEAFLKSLINGEIFRPLEFVKKSPDEQAKIILNMLEIPWTMDDINNWFNEIPKEINYEAHILQVLKQIEKSYYDQRENVNREISVLKAQIKGIKDELPANYDGEFWRNKSIQGLYTKVAEAEEINKKVTAARNIIENLQDRIAAIKSEAEKDKQAKKSDFESQRTEIKEYKQFLSNKIEKSEEIIAQSDVKIAESEKMLDLELQNEIEKLKAEYEKKKLEARKAVQMDVQHRKESISEHKQLLSAKEQELTNISQLEQQSLVSIDEKAAEKIETEKAKVGNAQEVLKDNQETDVEPLRKEANEVANMQSYLREYDRMADMIKTKLAPRQESSETLTARIKKARELPMELLKIAAVPIPGITVDNDGLIRIGKTLIGGLSEGEQLELAFRVAKAQCGPLKVICLDGINKINNRDRIWIENEMQVDEYQYFVTSTEDGELQIETKEGIA
ncbi:MAG: hypothetical protein VR72_02885 [Clostridiaceae bacterium BRH_c20a]|nr:MAG: hypothetical protein VR72_02885 [Clostridiaceae bacterium BRH_c20a]